MVTVWEGEPSTGRPLVTAEIESQLLSVYTRRSFVLANNLWKPTQNVVYSKSQQAILFLRRCILTYSHFYKEYSCQVGKQKVYSTIIYAFIFLVSITIYMADKYKIEHDLMYLLSFRPLPQG